MAPTAPERLSVVIDRELAYPPEKIWRMLTEPQLIEQWLMKNDFRPLAGHHFKLSADWGTVDCKVGAIDAKKTLSYTWNAFGLESVVTWTLSPTGSGTQLRLEHSGFSADQPQYYEGAKGGWQRFLAGLERALAKEDSAPAEDGDNPSKSDG